MVILWFAVLLMCGCGATAQKIKCGFNEMPVKCKTICPPQSCDIAYTEYACGKPTCEPGCDCIPDHLRNDSGICIPNKKCPPPPTIPICSENEKLSNCKIVCPPQTCESIYTLYSCIEGIPCEWGCDCVPGYLRNSSGTCIPSEKCPTSPPLICGKNERPSDCRVICPPQTCDSIFSSFNCEGQNVCEPGCDCLDGYLRNSNGECIPSDECFSEPECSIPIKCRPTCAVPNPPGCNYTPSETNQDGCNCKRGFVLSKIDGKCIEVEKCPSNIGCNGDPHATIKLLPPPCPSTCASPDASLLCKRARLPLGCECNPGFILDNISGKCIRPDKCKYGNPCGPNGVFVSCKYICPYNFCPQNDRRDLAVCDPPLPSSCVSGCICQINHKYLSFENRTCIRSDLCPRRTCTRRHEHWDACPKECFSGYCEDVDKDLGTCNTLLLNCNPQCVCDDTYFRHPDTHNCVSSEECRKINRKNESCEGD